MTALVCFVVGLVIGCALGWVGHLVCTPVPVPFIPPPRMVAPAPAPKPEAAPRVPPRDTVTIKFMDANERKCLATAVMDRKARRATMMHGGRKYVCARIDANDHWLYRQVPY